MSIRYRVTPSGVSGWFFVIDAETGQTIDAGKPLRFDDAAKKAAELEEADDNQTVAESE
jgi:hypothetical protein